jgi:hypothetical protein
MRMRTLLLWLLVLVAALAAGCGGSTAGGTHGTTTGAAPSGNGEASKPAKQVLADSRHAAQAAKSVHLAGHVVSGGQSIGIDLTIAGAAGSKGKMTLGGLGVSLVRVGPKVYIRGTDAFWRHFGGGAAVALLHGRWLAGSSTTGQLASIGGLTSLPKLFGQLTPSGTTLTNRGVTTYQGRQVVDLHDAKKSGDLYVAATGKPYPVALVIPKGSNSGKVTFDRWNETVTVTAPRNAIDLSALTGSG